MTPSTSIILIIGCLYAGLKTAFILWPIDMGMCVLTTIAYVLVALDCCEELSKKDDAA